MIRKFKVTVQFTYDVDFDENEILSAYGTTDPQQMAEVDMMSLAQDPGVIAEMMIEETYRVFVEPVE